MNKCSYVDNNKENAICQQQKNL